jgi:haloacetate dehalogenase
MQCQNRMGVNYPQVSEAMEHHHLHVIVMAIEENEPGAIHAICEDYRAAASIDLEHDAVDAGRKLDMPLLALWGAKGVVGELFDVLATWRAVASDVRGMALNCGHSPQEEQPGQTAAALLEFLDSRRVAV